jgi:hypothetical protein
VWKAAALPHLLVSASRVKIKTAPLSTILHLKPVVPLQLTRHVQRGETSRRDAESMGVERAAGKGRVWYEFILEYMDGSQPNRQKRIESP